MSVILDGTAGLTFNDGSTQNTAATGFGFKNRIINGAMVIDQRNVTVTSTAAGAYITDRWNTYADQAYSIVRDSDAPPGYAYSLKVTKTSSNQSSYAFLVQYIEGLNCIDLAFGTASAATVTVSFWVRSSITGNFAVSITNSAENRTYAALYAINSANTWEYKTVTIPGDTSGTWLKTNGKGISLQFNYGQAAGAGAVNSWVSATNIAPAGCTSLGTSNGATFYITGVQLEKGSTATSFDYRPYGTELALCQRYYWGINGSQLGGASETQVGMFTYQQANGAYAILTNPVQMRSSPVISVSGNLQWTQNGTQTTVTNVTGILSNPYNNMLGINVISGLTVGTTGRLSIAGSASGVIQFSSEL